MFYVMLSSTWNLAHVEKRAATTRDLWYMARLVG